MGEPRVNVIPGAIQLGYNAKEHVENSISGYRDIFHVIEHRLTAFSTKATV